MPFTVAIAEPVAPSGNRSGRVSQVADGEFRTRCAPVLDQGISFTCAGHACATMLAILSGTEACARMIYHLARRLTGRGPGDPGGVPLEAALRVCCAMGALTNERWKLLGDVYAPDWALDPALAEEARPHAPAWVAPIDPQDVDAIRTAIRRHGGVVAALRVHDGWFDLFTKDTVLLAVLLARAGAGIGPAAAAARGVDPRSGRIPWPAPDSARFGCHAVVVVGFDAHGFWVQNSFGRSWGDEGCGYVSMADWLANAREVWEVAAPAMRAAA